MRVANNELKICNFDKKIAQYFYFVAYNGHVEWKFEKFNPIKSR